MTGSRPGAQTDPTTGEDTQQAGLRGAMRRLWPRSESMAAGRMSLTSQDTAAGQREQTGGRVTGDDRAAAADGVGDAEGRPQGPAPGRSAVGPHVPAARQGGVPRLLQEVAAWAWRLLLVAVVVYVAFRLAVALRLVVLPLMAAILLTALLQPITSWLKQRGMSPLLATWCTFLAALLVIAGAITLFANGVSADYPALSAEVQRTATQVQHSLAGAPFHLNAHRLQQISNDIGKFLSQHKAEVAGTVLTGGKYAVEVLTGIVLTLFIAFFLLKDGARIWAWLISGLRREEARNRARSAGDAAWRALVNYMHGTIAVAAIHALFIGLAIWLLGVPLLVPFIVLVFLAAFVPIIGILVVGGLACLVALATKGWVAAVILLAVLILENQIESHLLQPLVVGRIVRLHPLAIILVLAVGAIIAGIPGAIVAVPVAAVVTYAWLAVRPGGDGG